MFIRSNKNSYATFDKFSIHLPNSTFASDVIIHNKKHYIKVNIDDEQKNRFHSIDKLGTTLGFYKNSIEADSIIFIKLPYRYNRYELKWIELTNSDCLKTSTSSLPKP